MTGKRSALVLSLMMAAAMAPAAAAAPVRAPVDEWTILPPPSPDGPFHPDELPDHPAPEGFALTVVDGLWHLLPASVAVKVIERDSTGAPYAVTLSATPPGAFYYLRVPGFVPGKVDAPDMRFKGVFRRLEKASLAVPFKGTPWRFELQAGAVYLTDGTLRQKIVEAQHYSADEADMHSVTLQWAGDLDRDGKLDFIVDDSFDDGGTTCLWLSSKAAAGALAAQVGCQDHHF